MTTNQKGKAMGNTVEQERALVRRWEDVANELPRAFDAPGQVMLVPRPNGRPGLAVVVGGRGEAAIIPAAQEGEWEGSFELGALDTLPYTGEYAPQIADRLTRCALTRLACEAPVKAGCLDAEDTRISWAGGGRRAELPVWPGRGENGLGERERGIINKFLDLVQEDIHNHTFTEENNR